MKPVLYITMFILKIVICDHIGSIQNDKNWRSVHRERTCLSPRGTMGIYLPPRLCVKYMSNGSLNYMLRYLFKRNNGKSLVCCSVSRRWPFVRRILLSSSYSLPIVPAASARATSPSNSLPSPLKVLSQYFGPVVVPIDFVPLVRHRRSIAGSGKTPAVTLYLKRNSSTNTSSFLSTTLFPSSSTVESSTKMPTTIKDSMSSTSLKFSENDYATEFPEPPVCGVSQGQFSKVVGGNNASLGDFPWIGVVAYRTSQGVAFKCGASLITSQHSLTAAHCIVGFEDTLYFVRLGELDFVDHSQTRPVDAVVKTIIKHEQYNRRDLTNDIGLLVFYRKVLFTNVIRPICLPLSDDLRSNKFVGYRPFVAGWGRTSFQGPAPTRLQTLQIPVVSHDRCNEAYAFLKIFVIDDRVLCAGGAVGKDACYGDSGGPLMQPIWDPTNYTTYFYQTGIVSFGMKCGTAGFPGVYTRVTEYIPWIRKYVLGTNSS